MKRIAMILVLCIVFCGAYSQTSKYNSVLNAFLNDSLFIGWSPSCYFCDTLFINDAERKLNAEQMPAFKECLPGKSSNELDSLTKSNLRKKEITVEMDSTSKSDLKKVGITIDYARAKMQINLIHLDIANANPIYTLRYNQSRCLIAIRIQKRKSIYRVYFFCSNSNASGHFDYRLINQSWKRVNIPQIGQS